MLNPVNRVHILGASGSGTSTFGQALAAQRGFDFLDTDDFFWQTKYSVIREKDERLALLGSAVSQSSRWVLSGSLCGWGDGLIDRFDLVIFLYLPPDIRRERLMAREALRYGDAILPGGSRYDDYLVFLEWAKRYDTGGSEVRSLHVHNEWLKSLPCPVLRIEGDIPVPEKIRMYDGFIAR